MSWAPYILSAYYDWENNQKFVDGGGKTKLLCTGRDDTPSFPMIWFNGDSTINYGACFYISSGGTFRSSWILRDIYLSSSPSLAIDTYRPDYNTQESSNFFFFPSDFSVHGFTGEVPVPGAWVYHYQDPDDPRPVYQDTFDLRLQWKPGVWTLQMAISGGSVYAGGPDSFRSRWKREADSPRGEYTHVETLSYMVQVQGSGSITSKPTTVTIS